MSVSSLPEWKQLLLDRKRREEEVREKQEREEQERLASMPAWKRGIIERRRAKQEGEGEREKEGSSQAVDGRAFGQRISEMVMPAGMRLEDTVAAGPNIGPEPQSQVSVETIGPVRQNPFLLAQSGKRKKKEEESGGEVLQGCKNSRENGRRRGTEEEVRCKEREWAEETGRRNSRGYDRECGREKEQEIPLERQGDHRDSEHGGKGSSKGTVTPREKEQHNLKGRQGGEGDKSDSNALYALYPLPIVPCLHTIRAENIIIIEKERNSVNREEQRERGRMEETEPQEAREKRGMTVDLRDILAGGGSVTEIRASEVLIIKPISSVEHRGGTQQTVREKEGEGRKLGRGVDKKRDEPKREAFAWSEKEEALGGKDFGGEREGRSWPKVKVATQKETGVEKVDRRAEGERRELTQDEKVSVETAGRVSQILSKFGELKRTPSRSKSTDSFSQPEGVGARWNPEEGLILGNRGEQIQGREEREKQEERGTSFRGVPKRSFSFSDHVACSRENEAEEEEDYAERRIVERTCSDRRVAHRGGYREAGFLKVSQWESEDRGQRSFSESTPQGVAGRYEENVLGPKSDVEDVEEKCQGQSGMMKVLRKEQKKDMCISTEKHMQWEDGRWWKKEEEGKEDALKVLSSRKPDTCQLSQVMSSGQNESGAERDTGIERVAGQDLQRGGKSSLHTEGDWDQAVRKKEGNAGRIAPDGAPSHWMEAGKEGSHQLGKNKPVDGLAFQEEASSLPLRSAEQQNRHVTGHLNSEVVHCLGAESPAPGRESEIEEGFGRSSKRGTDMCFHADGNTARDGEGAPSHPYVHKGYKKGVLQTSADQERDKGSGSQDMAVTFQVNSTETECPSAASGIRIPRAHFFGLEAEPENASSKMRSISNMDGVEKLEGGMEVEKRESWRAGRPLTRIESLRERLRQRELEKRRAQEGEGEAGYGTGDRCEKEGRTENAEGEEEEAGEERKKGLEWEQQGREVAEKKGVNTEQGASKWLYEIQEGPPSSTSSPLDVRREAGMRKPCPQLPGSISFSRLYSGTREEGARGTAAACPWSPTCPLTDEIEDEEGQHVEESAPDQQKRRRGDEGGTDEQEEEDSLEEAYNPQCLSPSLTTSSSDTSQSPPSPLLPSLVDMSRIYNQKPVVARAPLSVGKSDPAPQSLKVQGREPAAQVLHAQPQQDYPFQKGGTTEQQSPSLLEMKAKRCQQGRRGTGEETDALSAKAPSANTGIQMVRRQVELLKLREPEAGRQAPKEGTREARAQKGPPRDRLMEQTAAEPELQQRRKLLQLAEQHRKEPQQPSQRTQPDDGETPHDQKVPVQLLHNQETHPKQSQPSRSFTVNPKSSPTLEKTPESSESESTSDPSAPASTSASPTCTPSTPLFSLRSASAVQSKRGNTITITPRRSPAGSGTTATPATSRTPPSTQTSAPNGDAGKKRYPTAEEIVVIGGYQSLEKSCLVKQGRTHKGAKVCFDETQLEQVCEYPSESTALASLPCPQPDSEREVEERVQGQEEEEEEEEEEGGMFVSSSSGRRAFLRVDESCRR